MLGWEIFVYRQLPGESIEQPSKESLVGFWHGSYNALRWVDHLVEEGLAKDVGGNGYPCRYLARAKDVIAELLTHEAPEDSRVKVDRASMTACSPDEQLIIEAWDQS